MIKPALVSIQLLVSGIAWAISCIGYAQSSLGDYSLNAGEVDAMHKAYGITADYLLDDNLKEESLLVVSCDPTGIENSDNEAVHMTKILQGILGSTKLKELSTTTLPLPHPDRFIERIELSADRHDDEQSGTSKGPYTFVASTCTFPVGNLDGSGTINAVITQLLERGVIWIQSTGDYRQMSYRIQSNEFLTRGKNVVPLTLAVKSARTDVDLYLGWSEWKSVPWEDVSVNNRKFSLTVTGPSNGAKQLPLPLDKPVGKLPLKILKLHNLAIGSYQIEININSAALPAEFFIFAESKKLPRTNRQGEEELAAHLTQTYENKLPPALRTPADHDAVITAGFNEGRKSLISRSSWGSTRPNALGEEHAVPHIWMQRAYARFTTGKEVKGSAIATAQLALVAILLRAKVKTLTGHDLNQEQMKHLFDVMTPGKKIVLPTVAHLRKYLTDIGIHSH